MVFVRVDGLGQEYSDGNRDCTNDIYMSTEEEGWMMSIWKTTFCVLLVILSNICARVGQITYVYIQVPVLRWKLQIPVLSILMKVYL